MDRFLQAQEPVYHRALAELESGKKQSHWIWYIFPQLKGLGYSYNSSYYGISGIEEAKEYLNHPILGTRLREASNAVLSVEGIDIDTIMSRIDAVKLMSSMTLFDFICPNDVFAEVLIKYYNGMRDSRTLNILNSTI